jgi:small-conductance mechanosensitive channel
VIVTSFENHAIQYRLRAYTNKPETMMFTRSQVMESVARLFNQSGYEILSPLYHVKREATAPAKDELRRRWDETEAEGESSPEAFSMFDELSSKSDKNR